MKKTKIIIPALGLLLLSTAASVTGTVAWFSSNSTVSATGMTISAKTDSNFLIICEGAFVNTARTTQITSTATAKQLYPVAPVDDDALTTSNVNTASSWQYAYAGSPNQYAASTPYQTPANLTDYLGSETFSVGLNTTSATSESANNLVLRSVDLPNNTGISIIVCWNSSLEIYRSDSNTPLDLGVKANKNGLLITLYYFIDGENSNVFSENATNLTGSCVLTFDVNSLS